MVHAFHWLNVAMVLALPLIAESASMKCGQSLIANGDSKFVVRSRCGDPAAKETRTVVVREKSDSKHELLVEKRIEEWTYNFGSNQLLQIVTFENGIVVDVKSAGYGQ
jgi:hypothetical protein